MEMNLGSDCGPKCDSLVLESELTEALTEIARYHRDFEAIREFVHAALELHPNMSEALLLEEYEDALKQVRQIVG